MQTGPTQLAICTAEGLLRIDAVSKHLCKHDIHTPAMHVRKYCETPPWGGMLLSSELQV